MEIISSLTFHSDPSHGWLAVPASEVARVGVNPTRYSYRSPCGKTLYLEEDCDATAYLAALRMRNEPRPQIIERHSNGDSFIRRLPHYC
jgi:hypothetical protein